MKHLSLFSGIGGLDLAAEWAGFETVAFVERDPYCQRVLAKHWPDTPIIGDIRDVFPDTGRTGLKPGGAGGGEATYGEVFDLRAANAYGGIQLISGGFPCQPHSVAGKRQASSDDRDLWPEFARVIREIRPRWVVAENVPGLLSSESGRFFGTVLRDLAEMGYSAGWGVWGACDVGALHRRDRVFIVAHAPRDESGRDESGREEQRPQRERVGLRGQQVDDPDSSSRARQRSAPGQAGHIALLREGVAHPDEQGPQGRNGGERGDRAAQRPAGARSASTARKKARALSWLAEPDVGRVAHGVPSRVDRLRALGNAVVPQQAYPLFFAIAERERAMTQYSQDLSTEEK